MRHAAPAGRPRLAWLARTAGAALSGWFLLASLVADAPRYERVSGALVALAVLTLSTAPRTLWNPVRAAASGCAALLTAVAGIVAGTSLDEAFTLLSYAVLLACVAAAAGRYGVRSSAHRLEEEIRALRRTVDRL